MSELDQALRSRRIWFGSYTRDGRLIKVQVWCFEYEGNLEFLTDGNSLKARRGRRNPQVVCFLGAKDGPEVRGTAQIITDRQEVWRGYQAYWKQHFPAMLLLWYPIRRNIKRGRQVLVRVHPEDTKPQSSEGRT